MRNKQTGWAIAGNHGLYVGWRFSKREMIAEHVSDLHGISAFTFGGLTEDQQAAWKICRKNGDRAVKVEIKIV